jgi:poly(3-hydroxybutyrate) depolymerase
MRMHSCLARLLHGILLAIVTATTASAAPVPLPAFHIDITQTTVSGLSSGAFMAVQFGVAHSSIVKGVGAIAGGPYYCAQGDVDIATSKCSCTGLFSFSCEVGPGETALPTLIKVTDANARAKKIDPVERLADQRIWLFSGTKDHIVPPQVMKDLRSYYLHYAKAENIRFRDDVAADHAFPTEDFGNRNCGDYDPPFINKCGLDAAGELLKWMYPGIQPRAAGQAGRLIEFDQSEFAPAHHPVEHGLAPTGFIYVPPACEANTGTACRLHIAFHGCKQNVAAVGDAFIRHAGYNRWADTNKLIILYPQTAATSGNPNACWDWFDFNSDDPGYATKTGREISAVRAMVDRVAGMTAPPASVPWPRCITASNAEHVEAGRAHDWFFFARANGSNSLLGPDNGFFTSTLRQTGANYYDAARSANSGAGQGGC